MRWIMAMAAISAFAFLYPGAAAPAHAEVGEIRFTQQFSMGYLQFNVMKHRGLLEKHVAELCQDLIRLQVATRKVIFIDDLFGTDGRVEPGHDGEGRVG